MRGSAAYRSIDRPIDQQNRLITIHRLPQILAHWATLTLRSINIYIEETLEVIHGFSFIFFKHRYSKTIIIRSKFSVLIFFFSYIVFFPFFYARMVRECMYTLRMWVARSIVRMYSLCICVCGDIWECVRMAILTNGSRVGL